jgi:predicted regulator of amino acid metabolism with ACT domain
MIEHEGSRLAARRGIPEPGIIAKAGKRIRRAMELIDTAARAHPDVAVVVLRERPGGVIRERSGIEGVVAVHDK